MLKSRRFQTLALNASAGLLASVLLMAAIGI